MEWVETTGRSVDEAKEAALDQLGVDESDAEFVVVSEPRPGLFGRLRGEARVRARVRPTSPRPKRSRAKRQGQEGRGQRRQRASGAAPGVRSGDRPEGAVSVQDRREPDLAEDAGVSATGAVKPSSENGIDDGGTRTGQSNRRRRSRGGARRRNGTSGGADSEGRATRAPRSTNGQDSRRREHEVDVTKEEDVGEELSLEEQGESARDFLEGLVGLLGLSATVTAGVVDESTVQVSIDGPEMGILIGPGGGTLAALQELARTVVQQRTGGRSERILVDVAGYRAKRAAALQRFTKQVAEEVLSSSSERALEPMSASDRKVVHDAVNEIEGVVTRSVGEEPRRYIVVAPAPEKAEAVSAEND